ncbi:MAG: 4-alpha-glucanotransferase [Treponema sp.]|nr:4-alpha-glucanotransferase [Treponema sp.]
MKCNLPKIQNKSGVVVPLASLRTEAAPVTGDFLSLMEFADFAREAGLSVIQILPVLDTGTQSSPYSSLSAFALHPMYIRLEAIDEFPICLEKDSVFKKTYNFFLQHKNDTRFDYDFVTNTKDFLMRKIFDLLTHSKSHKDWKAKKIMLEEFINKNDSWLPYYCVYKYLKYKFMQASWKEWDKDYQKLSKEEILKIWNDEKIRFPLYFYAWQQLLAFIQFKTASNYVKEQGIILKGDLPILLNEDSCDVWAFPEVFNQKMKAGSPPDGDNPSGQNWGFPCYDFEEQEKDGFAWWRRRISQSAQFFSACRLDHIPGFFRLWSIPEGESTAELGHTEPYSPISEAQLIKAGFGKDRIRWLSQPHIPTEDFIRLIGKPDATREILSILCDRIGREELWLFKPSVKSEKDIDKLNLDKYNIDESIQIEIFNRFKRWWKNRALIEVKKNKFLPLWKYGESRAWNSLSQDERAILSRLFSENSIKQEKLWKKQAEKLFTAIKSESDMIICGEDLGVQISCMEKVLDEFGILGLKVFRWCRNWEKEDQPFQDIHSFRKLSVATTSVHDSTSLRENYNNDSKRTFIDIPHDYSDIFIDNSRKSRLNYFILDRDGEKLSAELDPKSCENMLTIYANTNGAWYILPLQDWLYLDQKYYTEDQKSERINIPGTVSSFNWTWRMPLSVSKLSKNTRLIEKISKIAQLHDSLK